MKENGLKIGVITVLTKQHLPKIKELYSFFKEENIDAKVNPIFSAGRGASVYDNVGITPEEYGKAMIELFNLYFYDPNPTISIVYKRSRF